MARSRRSVRFVRVATIVAAVALVGAPACGTAQRTADDGPQTYGSDAGDEGASTTTTAPAAPTPTGEEPAATTSPPGRPRGTAATTSSSPPPTAGGATRPGSGDVVPTRTDDGSTGPPGAFARTLLRPSPATAVVVERFAQTGANVATAAIERSARVLGEVTAKPVDLRPLETLPGGAKDWTDAELRALADDSSRVAQGNGRAVLHLLQVRGTFRGSDDVLGVAVRGDVFVLFVDNIAGSTTPIVSKAAIEDAVVLHEIGHLLGLVDLARNTGRADAEHPGHSANTGSVMYWAVESSLVGQVLNGPPPRDFDEADLADLAALRNGA